MWFVKTIFQKTKRLAPFTEQAFYDIYLPALFRIV